MGYVRILVAVRIEFFNDFRIGTPSLYSFVTGLHVTDFL